MKFFLNKIDPFNFQKWPGYSQQHTVFLKSISHWVEKPEPRTVKAQAPCIGSDLSEINNSRKDNKQFTTKIMNYRFFHAQMS